MFVTLYYTIQNIQIAKNIFLSKVETDDKRYLLYPYLFSTKKKIKFQFSTISSIFFSIVILPNEKTVRFQNLFQYQFSYGVYNVMLKTNIIMLGFNSWQYSLILNLAFVIMKILITNCLIILLQTLQWFTSTFVMYNLKVYKVDLRKMGVHVVCKSVVF